MNLKRSMRDSVQNEKGAALLTVFIVIMVLLTLGMGLLSLTYGNAQQAKVDDTYEKAYYVAESGAQQGVEYVRQQVLAAYNTIRNEMNSGNSLRNNSASFFGMIDLTKYSPVVTDSSIAAGSISLGGNIGMSSGSTTREFTIRSTATSGSVSRVVLGKLSVTFSPLKLDAAFNPLGAQAVITGGTFDAHNAYVSITGGGKFNSYSYKDWNFNVDGTTYSSTGTLPPSSLIDTTLATTLKFPMKYPGFTAPTPVSVLPLTLGRQIANGESVTNGTFSVAPYNWTVPSPIYLEGQPGASFSIESSLGTFNGGQIIMSGTLTDSASIVGSSSNYVKIFCNSLAQSSGTLDYVKIYGTGNLNFNSGPSISNSYIYTNGNVSFSGRSLSNVTIICDGNLTINGGGESNLTIYCKGTINDSSTSRSNVKIYCDKYYMSGGNVSDDSIVLAKSYMSLESTINGFFYCGGNIDLTHGGSGVTGQIAALGNITTTGYTFKYDSALMARLNADSFLTSSPASGSGAIVLPLNATIFPAPVTISEQ